MATKIGSVNVYWKDLDIYAFTGEILETQGTTYTTVTGQTNGPVTTSTSHYIHLFLRAPDGREDDFEFRKRVGFRSGQTATFLWASSQGPTKGEYVAVYNNSSGQINIVRPGLNRMACFPAYTWLGVLAVIVGVIGLISGGFFGTVIGLAAIGFLVFTYMCQKRLMAGVTDLARAYQPLPA